MAKIQQSEIERKKRERRTSRFVTRVARTLRTMLEDEGRWPPSAGATCGTTAAEAL